MKSHKSNTTRLIGLCVVVFCSISYSLSAQLKFTLLLSSGTYHQYSFDGLKLTFNNNGSFTIWQNNTNDEMSFATVDKVIFTDQILNIRDKNVTPAISSYVDPTGILHIEGKSAGNIEICIYSLHGVILFKNEQLISDPIDISNLLSGVYILKAGDQYIKFLKP